MPKPKNAERRPLTTEACDYWVQTNAPGTICNKGHGAKKLWKVALKEMCGLELGRDISLAATCPEMKKLLKKVKKAVKDGIMASRKCIIRKQRAHGPSVPGGLL